uniref:Putative secreted protein n=1 Tax=Amblyomma americanum TaxID=6943 RepID=A0A0C9RWD1_AMBAM
MRALVACLALFLTLAVLHCDAKRKKRDAENQEGNCNYLGNEIKDGKTKRLQTPCVKVSCSGGSTNVTKCDMLSKRQIKRAERKNKRNVETEDAKHQGESEEEGENVFPRCCPMQED